MLQELMAQCDLDGIGVAPALPVPVNEQAVKRRILTQLPPELRYLQRSLAQRLNPRLVLDSVKSVVVGYVSYAGNEKGIGALSPGSCFISRFAWCRDYHRSVGIRAERLRSLISTFGAAARAYVDTGPVFEKAYAAAAGLGFIGKNTLLITPGHGSFVFLCVVLTSMEIEPTFSSITDGCGSCRACVDACPTGALDGSFGLDISRCIAHLNASARTPIPHAFAKSLRSQLYGCDICQEVCPYNKRASRPHRPEFRPLMGLYMPAVRDIIELNETGFRGLFASTPVIRRGFELVRSTASLIASVT